MGGFDGEHRLKSVECYNPEKNQWMLKAPMNHVRSDADATVADGKIYIVGGFDGNNCTSTVEMYDPLQDRWFMLPSMSISRSGVSCVSHNGYIYALGKPKVINIRNIIKEEYSPSEFKSYFQRSYGFFYFFHHTDRIFRRFFLPFI